MTGDISSLNDHAEFRPHGIRWLDHLRKRFFWTTTVKLSNPAQACLDCGLVWTFTLRIDELHGIMKREEIAVGLKKEELEL